MTDHQEAKRFDVSARLFAAATLAMSEEETRYYLRGVHVRPSAEGGVVVEATNGHIAFIAHDPDGHVSEPAILKPSSELIAALYPDDGGDWAVDEDGDRYRLDAPSPVYDDAARLRGDLPRAGVATGTGHLVCVAEIVTAGHFAGADMVGDAGAGLGLIGVGLIERIAGAFPDVSRIICNIETGEGCAPSPDYVDKFGEQKTNTAKMPAISAHYWGVMARMAKRLKRELVPGAYTGLLFAPNPHGAGACLVTFAGQAALCVIMSQSGSAEPILSRPAWALSPET